MQNSLWFEGVEPSDRSELIRIIENLPIEVIITPPNQEALDRNIQPLMCVRKVGEGYYIMPMERRAQYFIEGLELKILEKIINGKAFKFCPGYVPLEEDPELLAQTFFNDSYFTHQ